MQIALLEGDQGLTRSTRRKVSALGTVSSGCGSRGACCTAAPGGRCSLARCCSNRSAGLLGYLGSPVPVPVRMSLSSAQRQGGDGRNSTSGVTCSGLTPINGTLGIDPAVLRPMLLAQAAHIARRFPCSHCSNALDVPINVIIRPERRLTLSTRADASACDAS